MPAGVHSSQAQPLAAIPELPAPAQPAEMPAGKPVSSTPAPAVISSDGDSLPAAAVTPVQLPQHRAAVLPLQQQRQKPQQQEQQQSALSNGTKQTESRLDLQLPTANGHSVPAQVRTAAFPADSCAASVR